MRSNALIILLALIPSFIYCQNGSTIQLGSEEFNELISVNKGILLDVRTSSEYKNGHLLNAGNLNFYAFDFRKKLALLPKDQPLLIYCNTGYRSDKAADILIKNGYTHVYNLEHGIMEWEVNNLPVIVEPDARPDTYNKMDPDQYYALVNSDSLVFIDFYAPWCGPCKKMMPMIDSIKVEYHQKIEVHKVNVDASKKLVRELKLVGVPYLVLFHKGEILYSRTGSISRLELISILEESILNKKELMNISGKTEINPLYLSGF